MKSGAEFLYLVHGRAQSEIALRKKRLRRNTGMVLSAFAFVLICGGVWLYLLPSLSPAKEISSISDLMDTESFSEEAADDFLTSSAATASFDTADGTAGANSNLYKAFEAPKSVEEYSYTAASECDESSGAFTYTVRGYFRKMPIVYGYAVDYTDAAVCITVYTDVLPSEDGSDLLELDVLLDRDKSNGLPIQSDFVQK